MAFGRSPRGLRGGFDEMLAEMQRQFNEMAAGLREAQQQLPMVTGSEMVVDIREHDDEVLVVADLPGVERQDISLRLLEPKMLQISARHEEATEQEEAGYYLRERRFGSLSRTIALPVEVTDQGSEATFRNGVLEVRLKKTPEARGREILVGEGGGEQLTAGEPSGGSAAEEQRRHTEELRREAQEKMESSGYMSSEKVEQQAEQVDLGEKGSPEEARRAAELRKQKEQEYEEAKKKLT
ncbi:heat-shock protein Hsp20 [Methanoculleus taiwanensis]|uniref:Heat-shock protein Hsp20 n=1 Tax=Methanoculleus taiwanensis TaxID=1550565 RepID=A0A498H163_9EURY|nr:Hsp20/alpha crystallin family protein [Methanoculleus taiwanensis]RXE56065.1 heat-shock protein Hsp20 [Methanoculleus taiwanensis]